MSNINISVFFVTLNEIEKISEAIRSVSSLHEIIVVDSGSTDGTVEAAESLGAKVIHQDWLGFAKQKAFALEQCTNEWCLNLDGDEVVPPDTLAEIRSLIETNRCDLIRLPIEDIFMGEPMHPWSRKRSIIRVFKKSLVEYPLDRLVHENIVSKGKVVNSQHGLVHFGYDSLHTLMEKQNNYAYLMAKTKFVRGKTPSILKLCLVFPFTFLKVFVLRRLFLSGTRGFIQAKIEAMYAFLKEASLYEQQRLRKVSR